MDARQRGTAGASALREHERRRARREQDVRRRYPRMGGVLLALRGTPRSERNWAHGARGEELVATALDQRCRDGVVVLHDRRVPGRANIDHLAVAPSGVWVVDTKRYTGKVRVGAPLIGAATLRIAGRDKTKLVDALDRYCALVRAAVDELRSGVPVRGAFCFVEADLPLFGTPSIRGHACLHRRSLARRLNRGGPLSAGEVDALAAALADRFPPA